MAIFLTITQLVEMLSSGQGKPLAGIFSALALCKQFGIGGVCGLAGELLLPGW